MKSKVHVVGVAMATLIFGSASVSEGQIITAPDIGPIGLSSEYTVDATVAPGILPGEDGFNAIWDMTDLSGTIDQVVTLVDPSTVPVGVEFPNANLAIELNAGEGYVFLRLDPERLSVVGQVGDVDQFGVLEGLGLLDLTSVDLEVPLTLPDPVESLEFPVQYGTVYQSVGEVFFEVVDPLTFDEITVKRTISTSVTVDAQGLLVMPQSMVYDAIRLNKVILTTDSMFIDVLGNQVLLSVDVNPTYLYTWLTDDEDLGGMPVLEMTYNPFTEEVEKASYYKGRHVGLSDFEEVSLVKAYPNPASDVVNISLEKAAEGQLMIYDVTGKMISNQSFVGDNLRLATNELPIGLYHVQLQSDDKIQHTQFSVIR